MFALLLMSWATSLQGQVGLSSGVAQVALVARAAPGASIQAVSQPREIGRQGDIRQAVATIRFSANSGYRLVVRSSEARPVSRVWVRSTDGTYQEVSAETGVSVDSGTHSTGEVRGIYYRVESRTIETPLELPVRYDIVMDPAI